MSTIAIVQARLNSVRFPRKVLAELCGKSVIRHVVERTLQIRGVDRVIVAVPWGDQAEIAQAVDHVEREISVFAARVDDDDVLGRFVAALENYPECDTVIRLTGDSPLIDPRVCEQALALYQSKRPKYDYVWNVTTDNGGEWPDGLNVEVFSQAALMTADRKATDPAERQHVTGYIRRTSRVAALPMDPAYAGWPKCSIDDESDLDRVRQMLQQEPL